MVWRAQAHPAQQEDGTGAKTKREAREKKQAEVQKFFREFPETIPGAAEVRKFPVQHASHCLVHLKHTHAWDHIWRKFQEHMMKRLDDQGKRNFQTLMENKKMKNIIESQFAADAAEEAEIEGNVKSILTYLCDHCGIREVHFEGIAPPTERSFAEFNQTRLQGQQAIEKLTLLRTQWKDIDAAKRKEFDDLIAELRRTEGETLEAIRSTLGGAADLYLAQKIIVRAAETEEGNAAAMESLFTPEQHQHAQNAREEIVLGIAAGNPWTVVRFGSNHDWQDNIEQWNRQRPDEAFCLIEVTPTAVKKHSDASEKKR